MTFPQVQYLNDQHYRTCIRAERDACYMEFQTDPNHFMLQPVEVPLLLLTERELREGGVEGGCSVV